MKRVVISLCCAVLMIVTICAIVLPASAETADNIGVWVNANSRPTDYAHYICYQWSYVEPSPIEGGQSQVEFMSNGHTMKLVLVADQNSYTIASSNFRFVYSNNTLPEQFNVYDGTQLILRWSYADPAYLYIYNPGNSAPLYRFDVSDDEVDVVQFWCQDLDMYNVQGSLMEFYSMFGDVTVTNYPQQQIGSEKGYQDGYDAGLGVGYDRGYSVGYGEGMNVGAGVDLEALQREWYDKGYDQAETDLLDSETWGGNFLGDIFSAPMIGLSQFVLFEAPNGLQVTLGGVVGAVIGMILLVTFLKFFAGG